MEYDVIIIGAGPAGYSAAIRASQLGMRTAIVEKKYIGGMCMNWGCIPTKSIIESARLFDRMKSASEFGVSGFDPSSLAFNWSAAKSRSVKITDKLVFGINYIMQRNGVQIIYGTARLGTDKTVVVDDDKVYKAKNILIATGSKPKAMDPINGDPPIVDVENLFTTTELPENIVVTGNHASSVELAIFFRLIGKNVTLVTNSSYFMDGMDEHLIEYIKKKLETDKIQLVHDRYLTSYHSGKLKAGEVEIPCDLIVNCNSRKAIIPESDEPFRLTERGFIYTDHEFETSLKGVYAIGDVTGKSFVAHLASAQAVYAINTIKGIKSTFVTEEYPINLYASPEVAQIGLTEKQLKAEGIDYKVTEYPLSINAKALIEGNTEGFVRMLSDKKYGQVLGVQMVGANASDMIAEAAAFMSLDGTVFDVAQTIHAHPTVSEIFMEAGFDAVDFSMHS